MYKYRFMVAVFEGNVFSWASNREIKDYLEFASKNFATITTYARFVWHSLCDHKRDHELTQSLFTKYTDTWFFPNTDFFHTHTHSLSLSLSLSHTHTHNKRAFNLELLKNLQF